MKLNVPENHMPALPLKLLRKRNAPTINHITIPCRGSGYTRRENADEVGAVDGAGSVEHADSLEAEAGDGCDDADAVACGGVSCNHGDLFFEGEVG